MRDILNSCSKYDNCVILEDGYRTGKRSGSSYIQFKGFIKQRMEIVLYALGCPYCNLRELMTWLQSELDEGIT